MIPGCSKISQTGNERRKEERGSGPVARESGPALRGRKSVVVTTESEANSFVGEALIRLEGEKS